MAWTATVTNKSRDDSGRILVNVEFTDGTTTYTRKYSASRDEGSTWINKQVIDQISKYEELDTYYDTIATGAVSTTPLTPDPVEQWVDDYYVLKRMERVIADGLLADTATIYTNQRSTVETNFAAFSNADKLKCLERVGI